MLSILRLAQSFHCKTALFFSSMVFAAAAQAALPLRAGTYVDTQANECQEISKIHRYMGFKTDSLEIHRHLTSKPNRF